MNIVDPILYQCKLNPDVPAICAPGTSLHAITYGLLEGCIDNIGRMAVSMGLAPGNTVAILVQDKIFHAALILGLTLAGMVTVSARSTRLPRELAVEAVITDAAGPFENASRIIQADARWMMGDAQPGGDGQTYRSGGGDICRIILTSGTTGESKAIALSHNSLLGRNARYEYAKGNRFPLCSRLYCDLGLSTSPGFRYLIYMLSRGGTIFFYGDSPEGTAQAFDLYKMQAMVASPSGLGEWVKFFETVGAFQSGFDHVLSSGGLLPRALSERARARLCATLFCSYGSTETGTVCIGPAHRIADTPGAVGFVTPEAAVEIAGPSGEALPAGKEGIVRVRTPHNVDGYVGDPERSAKAFRDGWFYPGDIGYLTEDRMLVILGREDSVLSFGGDKVNPEVLEEVLLSFPGIDQAAAFTKSDEFGIAALWAAVVSLTPIDETALRSHCQRKLGRAFAPAHFIRIDALPRNEMGKLERRRLPALVASDSSKV